MIVETKTTPIFREGMSNESLFNIKKENVAHIFSILRNQLYSDKILAVIREYSTNAMDAHVEDGVSRPFEITLPTPLNPEFIVRDFGKGLSQEDIVEVFASYGESTKRLSNSFTGMLGLGSKSAFAYTNSFVVKSRYNGVEYTYSAFIDESNVGAISLVNQTPTTETGLSVHINVKPLDCRLFEDRCRNFFRYSTMMPIFTNNTTILESYKEKTPVAMEGSDWKIYNPQIHGAILVHMGNVAYNVPYEMMNDLFTPEQNFIVKGFKSYNGYLQGSWHIFAPIGSVKPSASRESLEFNDQTKKYIGTKIYEICLEIHTRILSEFKNKKSEWEKRIYADSMNKLMLNLPHEMISYCHPFLEKDLAKLGITKTRYERSVGRFSDDKHPTIIPKNHMIYFLDSPEITRVSVRERINHYLNTNNIATGVTGYYNPSSENLKSVGLISFKTDEHKNKFKKNKDFLGMNFVDLSEISYDPKKKSNPNAIRGDVGELFVFHPNEQYNLKKWKATESRPKKIVWVEISNFMPKEYKKDNRELNNILESLNNDFLSLNENLVIYGVKSANIKNVGEDWIELKDYYKNRIEEFKIKHKAEYDAYCRFDNLSPFWKSFIFDEHHYLRVDRQKTFDPKNYNVPAHFYEPFKPLYLEYCMYLCYAGKMSNIYKTARFLELEFFKEQKIEEIDKLVSDIPILGVFQYSSVPYEDLHKKITELL